MIPGIELVGIAVNASSLDSQPGRERALDRVAGLGMASLAVRLGADIEDCPGRRCQVDRVRHRASGCSGAGVLMPRPVFPYLHTFHTFHT
jgi:hypothetical protein